ncbi:MAG: lysine--tRNA ligase [Elusimicrobia bacterium RIFCSPLOWO2_01_FULL_54_10]|nr:MAG: lysine--tRNA ligase [Elusimicrobia bacterium RIFCSPLOWO2_01_FULL_54_10]
MEEPRKEKLDRLLAAGVNPYPARSEILNGRLSSSEIKKRYDSLAVAQESPDKVRIAGRMMTRRDMGKACFAHLQDGAGRIQIYVRKDVLGEAAFESFTKDLDLGDWLGAEGLVFRTKTGEISIRAEKIELLSKALRPLPEKWHGLKDPEARARQRELDLLSNEDSRAVFASRSRIIQTLRTLLAARDYMEVETPMMQQVPGGAVARPFETFHNALKQKFFLRVAPELFLKRCLVGGFEKVYEIGRVFRNEGIDTFHNPEFTILEAYEAYGNIDTMMDLTEYLVTGAAEAAGSDKCRKKPFARRSIPELFKEYVGKDYTAFMDEHKAFDHAFDEKIVPHLTEPTFVTDFPAELSPLAKLRADNPRLTERFELYVDGGEIANAYSELNNSEEQRRRLVEYRKSRTQGSEKEEAEGMGLDESFIEALEYGMPPAGGLGIGVDRLVMLFTGQTSIRNVLLFPTLKKET